MKAVYKINQLDLISKHTEKDLGILFSNDLKFVEHIDVAVKKANRQLGIISKVFKSREPRIILPLYKSFVRPILEYNSLIWSPKFKKDEEKIERVQKRMCNLMCGLPSLSYLDKLNKVNMSTLKARRIQHQLLFMFKMKKNVIDLNFDDFFSINENKRTRGNIFKLLLPKTRTNLRSKFFVHSAIKY